MSSPAIEGELGRARQVISERLGLHFPSTRSKDLLLALERVAVELKKPPASGFGWIFEAHLSTRAIDCLARHLTVGETYFFREKGVFSGLEHEIFPRLLSRRRGSRVLRVWSAGCCTGEEPYSVAMLLERLMPDRLAWDTLILATDLNTEFLERAERGVYNEWSFRDVSPELRKTYFVEREPGRYELLPRIRQRVTFSRLNLVDGSFPCLTNQMHDFDLILCRNVLMYFAPEQARDVIARLRASLVDGGFLVVSPTEVSQALFQDFLPVYLPNAVFYQRESSAAPESARALVAAALPAVSPRKSALGTHPVPGPLAGSPRASNRSSAERKQLPREDTCAAKSVPVAARLVESARRAADLGRLDEALLLVGDAIGHSKLDPFIHHLRATILEELGQSREAARALRVALYLDPEFVMAHFSLGHLCLKRGARRQARRQFCNVLSLLRGAPDDTLLPASDGLTAGRLRELSQSQIEGTQ